MKRAHSTSLCVLIAAANVTWAMPQARAQSVWEGNTPVFQSDIERLERQLEAERAERRQQYDVVYPKYMDGGEKPDIKPVEPPIVYLEKNEPPGIIIVDTGGRKLYYTLPGKRAYAYPISVGREGFTWTGTERISRIVSWPSWTPPPEMHRRQPGLPITVSGGIRNPLGAKALYLGSTLYRIHGTNNPRSIGRASSSGCFRMMNEHVVHLATLARVGTVVRVVSNYPGVSETAPLSSLLSMFSLDSDEKPTKSRSKSKRN